MARVNSISPLILVAGILLVMGRAQAEKPFVIRLQQTLPDVKVGPMLLLIRAFKAHPRQNHFLLFFSADGPMSQSHTKINFNRKSQTLFVRRQNGYLGSYLVRYAQVTPEKLRKCFHHKQTISTSDTDNFELLEDVGCPVKTLFFKAGYQSP